MARAVLIRRPQAQRGFTYLEALLATVLIALALVPALEAVSIGVRGAEVHETRAEAHYLLLGKLEDVLAQPFGALRSAANAAGSPTTPTTFSDTATAGDGRTYTRNVFVAAYDGDNADADDDPFTGTDNNLLWVRVAIPNTNLALESLTSNGN